MSKQSVYYTECPDCKKEIALSEDSVTDMCRLEGVMTLEDAVMIRREGRLYLYDEKLEYQGIRLTHECIGIVIALIKDRLKGRLRDINEVLDDEIDDILDL